MQTNMRRSRAWLATLALVYGMSKLTGCHGTVHLDPDNTHRETLQKRFTASKVTTLQLEARSGDITLQPAAEGVDEILIKATTEVRGGHSEAERAAVAARTRTTARLDGSTLVVETQYPEDTHLSVSVAYDLTVPRRIALNLSSHSGDINVQGAQGGMRLHTDSGDIDLKNVGGALSAETGSGGISLDGAQADGNLTAKTASGDIEIANCHAANPLQVSLNSANGSVQFSGDAAKLDAETANGDIEAKLMSNQPLQGITIHSANGAVTLKLPRSISAHFTAQTTDGDITLPDNLKSPAANDDSDDSSRHSVDVNLGNGGASVSVQTTTGDISLETE